MIIERINRSEALRYMGHYGEITVQLNDLADECEQELIKTIKPRYIYKVFDITHKGNGIEVENTTLLLKGKDIKKHLRDCTKCVLMCATVSSGVDTLVRSYEAVNMAKAFVIDSLASAAIEQVCNQAENEIKSVIQGYNFTWRFSPGYGDLPLEIQQKFVEILDASKRIGVNVTENMLLLPRKSVTAIIGLSNHEITKDKRGCINCNMRDNCKYKIRGERCGF